MNEVVRSTLERTVRRYTDELDDLAKALEHATRHVHSLDEQIGVLVSERAAIQRELDSDHA